MTDHILSIALTFALLAGGTVAIGSELIGARTAPKADAMAQITLPMVVVTGHRIAPMRVAAAAAVRPLQ